MRRKTVSNLMLVAAACIFIFLLVSYLPDMKEDKVAGSAVRKTRNHTIETLEFGVAEGNDKNVILITLDTLRADHMHYLGYERPTTPFLDSFADGSITFENAYAPLPLTAPSHTTMLTGLYPIEHGVRSNYGQTPMPSLAEMLNRTGYLTAAFVSAKPVTYLSKGFDVFDFYAEGKEYEETEFTAENARRKGFRRPGNETFESFRNWLESADIEDPAFIWVHFYDAHSPYVSEYKDFFGAEMDYNDALNELKGRDNETEYGKAHCQDQILKLYDGGVYTTDLYANRTLKLLEAEGLLDDAIIIIAGDHGENLGERSNYFHGGDVYDPTTRVPLLIMTPERGHAEVTQEVSLISLTPTILDYLDMEYDGMLSGPSLLPTAEEELDTPAFLESPLKSHVPEVDDDYTPAVEIMNIVRSVDRKTPCPPIGTECDNPRVEKKRIGMVHARKKLVYNGGQTVEFYDLEKDPEERHNIYGFADSEECEAMLDTWIRAHEDSAEEDLEEPDAETLEALRSLGYVG